MRGALVFLLLLLPAVTPVSPSSHGIWFQADSQPSTRGIRLQPDSHEFTWKNQYFILDGRPFVIRSGEMHYPRIPRAAWRDRLKKARAMGLNTICTYVFWNLHEPRPGVFDFSDNLDVAEFVRLAREEGLFVIVRPGPYICTEWDFGGFPAWLLKTPDLGVRTTDPRFLEAVRRYVQRVGRELAPLQVTRGGPIILVQVENEYGSFGSDRAYMAAIDRLIVEAGFEVLRFTSDGPGDEMLAGGTLPGVLSVINFSAGGDDVKAFATFDRFRQGVPRMCGELWVGWFDHWGEPHHVVAPEKAVQSVTWMLERGISFNIYMLHGGTTFGFMAGANSSKTSPYHPDTSSYDYDSPLDEAGRPTPKFHALRAAIQKFLPAGEVLPEVPASAPTVEIPPFALEEGASLFSLLGRPVQTERPQPMEAHDQAYGFVLYRKRLDAAARGTLDLGEVRDYALVLQGDRRLGTLDRRRGEHSLEVELTARAPLDLLVENMGRINFGARLVDDRKGLVNPVTLAGVGLTGWEIYALPLDDLEALRFSPNPVRGPAFYRGSFTLEATGDTFLDLRGWGKGHAWVNGHHLGRYWRIGPQQSLFIPGSWLGAGTNEVVILDVEEGGRRTARGLRDPVFETP